MLELQSDDEEEHREKSICGPQAQGEVQVERLGAELELDQIGVGITPR